MSDLNIGEIEERTRGVVIPFSFPGVEDLEKMRDEDIPALISEVKRLRKERSEKNKKYNDLHDAFVYFDWMLTRWRDDCRILRRMRKMVEDVAYKRTKKSIHDILREIGDERTVTLKAFKEWDRKEPGLITTNDMLNRKREIWDAIIALTPEVKNEEELLQAIMQKAAEDAKARGEIDDRPRP